MSKLNWRRLRHLLEEICINNPSAVNCAAHLNVNNQLNNDIFNYMNNAYMYIIKIYKLTYGIYYVQSSNLWNCGN